MAHLPGTRSAFGRRRVTPHVCLLASKVHIRTYLVEIFEELGFVTHPCDNERAVACAHHAVPADLVVVTFPLDGSIATAALRLLASIGFDGSILLIGSARSPEMDAARRLGEALHLKILSPLNTPFRTKELADRLSTLRPFGPPPQAPVDAREAMRNGWLEVWYQPKIDPRSMLPRGAEALCRLRHPTWGIVTPACFIPAEGDPHCRQLMEFVVRRAVEDWIYFSEYWAPVEISINAPLALLDDGGFVDWLRSMLPRHPAFRRLVIEIEAADIVRDAALARRVVRQLGCDRIGISIDNVGPQWSCFAELQDAPFIEMKINRQFVHGCADDRLKHAMCSTISDVARRFGVQTVAEGVETRADLGAVRELGFDLAQGLLLAKPLVRHKFGPMLLGRHSVLPATD